MLVRERAVLHPQRDQDVVAAGLFQGETLGVTAVEAAEPDGGGAGPHPGGVEQPRQSDTLERSARHPPTRDALHVVHDPGLRHRAQVGEGVGAGSVHQAVDGEGVVLRGAGGHRADHRVVAETAARQQSGQPGRVLLADLGHHGVRGALEIGAGGDSRDAQSQHPEDDPAADRGAALGRGDALDGGAALGGAFVHPFIRAGRRPEGQGLTRAVVLTW